MRRITMLYLVAAGLLLAALALRVAPVPVGSGATPMRLRSAPDINQGAPIEQPSGVTEAIVRGNVFSPSRRSPRIRYTPLDLASARSEEPASRAARRPTWRLFGTVVGPSGGTALIDADPAVAGAEIYRIGDVIGGSRIMVVSESTVVLQGTAGRTVLRLPPQPSPAP